MAQENKHKLGNVGTIIAVVIVLVLIFGPAFAIVWWSHIEIQKMIDKGCSPSGASDWLGNPTMWSCPVK